MRNLRPKALGSIDQSTVAMRIAVLLLGSLLVGTGLPPTSQAQVQSDSTYRVQTGDTLYGIARRFQVSVQALQSWNDMQGTALHVGQTLRVRPPHEGTVPGDTSTTTDSVAAPPANVDPDSVETPPAPYGRHSIESGDSFVTLALRLGTTSDSLFTLNDRTTSSLSVGTTVRLPRRFGPPTHVVQSGETLYRIAGEYGVSVRALVAENDLDTTAIVPGQRLRLPTRTAPSVPPTGEWASPDSIGTVSVYPDPFAGRLTASGLPYDPEAFVVSHPFLPYDSVVLLSRPDADRHTFARVIDRGPLEKGVLLDVSEAVAKQLGFEPGTTPNVAVRTVWIDDVSN